MAFDTKSPTPKVLFSPAGKVEDADLQIIARQAKSPAAEAAVKMNVYQSDTSDEVAAPASHRNEVAEDTAEPTKRESTKPAAAEKDISDVVKKWSKK
jgi:fructose-specific phosphotransferase system component IIB